MKWGLGFLIFVFLSLGLGFFIPPDRTVYSDALAFYNEGLKQTDTALRNKAFNNAINELLKSKKESVENNILLGLSLVQLRQYAFGAYVYLKAIKRDPSNKEIPMYLNEAIRLGDLPLSVPSQAMFGPSQAVLGFVLIFLFASLSFWLGIQSFHLKRAFLMGSCLLFIALFYLTWKAYRSPIFAILIHAQILFQTPNENAKSATLTPLAAGLLVTALDVADHGAWIKVRTSEGVMGYLPQDSLRIVE